MWQFCDRFSSLDFRWVSIGCDFQSLAEAALEDGLVDFDTLQLDFGVAGSNGHDPYHLLADLDLQSANGPRSRPIQMVG
jgi:hypothetical protein